QVMGFISTFTFPEKQQEKLQRKPSGKCLQKSRVANYFGVWQFRNKFALMGLSC
uniref:Uncharacterized protein n=1 Tax=Varanus komodoensis TaxID=61221 RepID=A0A8D2Q3A5_VARKO